MNPIRLRLIERGILNLQEYGYKDVHAENILTDSIYKSFFKVMLVNSKGLSPSSDTEIDLLITEINKNNL